MYKIKGWHWFFSYFKWALGSLLENLWNWLYEGKSDSSVVLVCDIDPV